MSLFNFILKPLEDIVFVETKNKPIFDWFALSDGEYYIEIDGQKIYTVSDEYKAMVKNEDPERKLPDYMDYQISRMHEDFLGILSTVLQEVPEEFHSYIKTVGEEKKWLENIEKIYDVDEEDEEHVLFDLERDASMWIHKRTLFPNNFVDFPIQVFFK
ncbi:hypothetical protein KKG22_05360 [Patescibacteria group bacterium]|nr:hypothetical protein [Patescibacteria group bacterium]MBU1721550.1 hypothetical protein [Patescibacteria group bacterium]MBU1901472.1 hypothetical protein [Patescibacteria group bacterium]